ERGGSLEELWALVNVPEEARALVAGYLVSTLRPEGPYFALVVQGEQGSAKSSLVRTLRSLVDPAKPALRSVPRNKEDLAIAANNAWIVALDNLSGIPEWLAKSCGRSRPTARSGGGCGPRPHGRSRTDSGDSPPRSVPWESRPWKRARGRIAAARGP